MIDARKLGVRERKYRNPPIVEVVCEFRFVPSRPWDVSVPELIYERLKDLFPVKRPLRQVGVHVHVQPQAVSFQQQVEEGVQFLREDQQALVRVQPHRVSVHHLAPYPHWEGFKPLIRRVFEACTAALPKLDLERVGLRYINRVKVSEEGSAMTEFFRVYPTVERPFLQGFSGFDLQLLYFLKEGRDALRLRLATEEPNGKEPGVVILDLDYFLAQENSVSTQKALQWVEEAHDGVIAAFESSITDKLRRQFDEEGQ